MSGELAPPHTSARRPELLERLLVALTASDAETLPIKTRFPDDPTIALLDAWATVGDVLGFYLDRIADEGYLGSATEPGSILALAALIGRRARPGLAASVEIALTLNADPDDKAVAVAPGLLCQSVPGPGEQPQTYETTTGGVARPSWALLKPKLDRPWTADAITHTGEIRIAGASSTLKANDVLLLEFATGADPAAVTVQSTTSDFKANVTTVSLQAPAAASALTPTSAGSAPADHVGDALEALLAPGALGKPASPVPPSVNHLSRTADTVFTPDSDTIPRLLSAFEPAVASHLYSALDNTPLGKAELSGTARMQVAGVPFGAQAPRKPLFDDSGRPAGSEPWPLGGTHVLTLTVGGTALAGGLQAAGGRVPLASLTEHARATDIAVQAECAVTGPADEELESASAVIDMSKAPDAHSHMWPPVTFGGGLGRLTLGTKGGELVMTYAGATITGVGDLTLSAKLEPDTDAVTVLSTGGKVLTWAPIVGQTVRGRVGGRLVSFALTAHPGAGPSLVVTITTSLPAQDLTRLQLDRIYDAIVPGTLVVIRSGRDGAPESLIAKVNEVRTVTAAGFGRTAEVTELGLDKAWLTEADVDQTALMDVTVSAAPAPVQLLPQPLADEDHPVAGDSIELDRLVAGMEAGRLIIVRGVRTDLPEGATITSGELAMIASLSAGGSGGDTVYTTLRLAAPLAYSYQRSTVQIFGNVVQARQGATLQEVLGSGQPAIAHQAFTLSSGPPLADPSANAGGFQSSLTVTVDGVGYQEVDRFDAATPPRAFMTGTDARGATTITFAAPLPAGSGNVRAVYRAGDGSQGNARAEQISQLLTRPSGLASVTNPLPARGGAPGDGAEQVRRMTPVGLRGLGRVVTVEDCGDLASSWAGVGKALATSAHIDGQDGVLITVAGLAPAPLPAAGGICLEIEAAIATEADPQLPVLVLPADLYLIVLQASVLRDPLVDWDTTADAVRTALLSAFGYDNRALGQDVAVSDLVTAAHRVPSVMSFTATALALVPATVAPSALIERLPALLAAAPPDVLTLGAAAAEWGIVPVAGEPAPAAVAYLSPLVPDMLIIQEQTP
jgi:hypothetical protein